VKKTVLKFFLYLLFLSGFVSLYSQTPEYKLKAVFLERFTRFVEWPDSQNVSSDSSRKFIIKVIGQNPFGTALEDLYTHMEIKNKNVRVDHISKISEIDGCHLLFISGSMKKDLDGILNYTKTKPILTVSDTKGFAEHGVIINFFISDNKLRFEINESSLIKSKLYMSYLLLNVAKIVRNKEAAVD